MLMVESFGNVSFCCLCSTYTTNHVFVCTNNNYNAALHNLPFISTCLGKDSVSPGDNGVFKVIECSEKPSRLQTITKIEKENDTTIKIFGGLSAKLVLPTHMSYIMTFKEVSHRQLQFSVEITQRDPSMEDYDRLILTYESRAEENFYGFGEQFSCASVKGQKVPILVRYVVVGVDIFTQLNMY